MLFPGHSQEGPSSVVYICDRHTGLSPDTVCCVAQAERDSVRVTATECAAGVGGSVPG